MSGISLLTCESPGTTSGMSLLDASFPDAQLRIVLAPILVSLRCRVRSFHRPPDKTLALLMLVQDEIRGGGWWRRRSSRNRSNPAPAYGQVIQPEGLVLRDSAAALGATAVGIFSKPYGIWGIGEWNRRVLSASRTVFQH